jgi:hypothetical protein
MADISGQASALTVITPVQHGAEDRLLDILGDLSAAPENPFGRTGRTHFARFVAVGEVRYAGPPPQPDPLASTYLLFTSSFDGGVGSYLEGVRTTMPGEADDVWGCCIGYPGAGNPVSFAAYLLHNRLPTTTFYAAYGRATVPRIRDALELRNRLSRLAVRTQGLPPAELRTAFEEEFPP